jgi:Tetratricopeptide repeat/Divergent InlB B-repeat domain
VTATPISGAVPLGDYTLEVGIDSASFAQFESKPENKQARALGAALEKEREDDSALVRNVEELNQTATVVTKKIERGQALSQAALGGRLLQTDALVSETDELLGLLKRLDRAGRFEEQLRLARALHGLLAVSLRWLELIRSLRGALRSARAVGDQNGQAWALHELGTLHLCAGNLEQAENRFREALEIQNEFQAAGWCATRHNLDCARRDRYIGTGGRLTRRQLPRGPLARLLAVLGVKGIVILILLIAAGSTAAGVALTAHGGSLQPEFDQGTLSFGAVTIGKTSPPQTLSLRAGSETVLVGPVSAGHPDEFLIDNSCPRRLSKGAICAIQVRFRPSTAGDRSIVLRIALGGGKALNARLVGSGLVPPTTAALTVRKAGEGSGAVASSPSGIACGSTCRASFAGGAEVVLTATAASGSTFSGWTGSGCSGKDVCRLRIGGDRSVTATFAPAAVRHVLMVRKAGEGSGAVASSPSGIACGSTCSAAFRAGSPVVLTATAAPGSVFVGWKVAGCRGTGPCTVTMSADLTAYAIFQPTHTLAVKKNGNGSGTVTSSPSGIACGSTCSAAFRAGSPVVLTATAASGSVFVGWKVAGCRGTGPCTVTMSADLTAYAIFNVLAVPA